MNNLPFPITSLEQVNKKHPKLWSTCDKYLTVVKDAYTWNENCYCPVELFRLIMEYYGQENNIIIPETGIITYCGLYNWKRYRQIYNFDADFVNVLIKSATDDIKIDEALKHLPFPSFYINIDGVNEFRVSGDFSNSNKTIDKNRYVTGFYVYRNVSIHNKNNYNKSEEINALKFDVYLSDGSSFSYELLIGKGKTVRESFDYLRENHETTNMNTSEITILEDVIEKAIVMILYLCAVNSDIKESPKQKVIRKTNINPNNKIINDVKKIKINDVGYVIGKSIRISTEIEDNKVTTVANSSKGSTKRPHQRRAHFHSYWVGSEKDGTKHIEIKWIAPIFVHLTANEEPTTRITPVTT